ncbi:MAG: YitT family protein [Bacteroidetes bacterium]|nr:YitT family protein [Bacteroidota bacterium]MBK9424206.1 YitT family protein [Bacteroidota bacterium]
MTLFKRRSTMMSPKTYRRKVFTKNILIDIFMVICGIFSAGLGLKGFLLPNDFIDGGVTGISLLIAQLTNIGLPFLIVIFNIPFIIMGYFQMGKNFALKTILAIIGLALCLYFVEFNIVTSDKLLISVFGGFFLGMGIGLSVRAGCVIDGTEILALYLSKRTPISIGGVILIINIIIFSFAAALLGVEPALYSLLTYLAASRTVDFIVHGIEEYTGVTIISSKSEEIRKMITERLGRGVTVYKGKGGYRQKGEEEKEVDVIFTVVTNLEMPKLKSEIQKIDSKAFIVMNTVNDTKGGTVKKRRLT